MAEKGKIEKGVVSMLKLNTGVKSGERLLIATDVSTSFGQSYALSIQWAQSSKRDEVSSLRVDMGNPVKLTRGCFTILTVCPIAVLLSR